MNRINCLLSLSDAGEVVNGIGKPARACGRWKGLAAGKLTIDGLVRVMRAKGRL